jgi:hypothetical protein
MNQIRNTAVIMSSSFAAQLHTAPNQLFLVFGRWEGERLELVQAIEAEKLASREALKPLDELRLEHSKLVEVSPYIASVLVLKRLLTFLSCAVVI